MGLKLASRELEASLELALLHGLGEARRADLVRARGSAARAVEAATREIGPKAAAMRRSPRFRERIRRARAEIDQLGIVVFRSDDPAYPARLHHLPDPPFLLFLRGRAELIDRSSVAVVGSRRATQYGLEAAAFLARGLGLAGLAVISGLARGIDAAAHTAALPTGTIGVLGCGIDVAYPPEQAELQESVAREGLLVSEFLPGEPPLRYHFPRRNRIIAALSLGVVVVEAALDSGAMITVRHALDMGREVFSVPGPIGRESSAGTNALVRDGATLVTQPLEILQELPLAPPAGTGSAGHVGTPAPVEIRIVAPFEAGRAASVESLAPSGEERSGTGPIAGITPAARGVLRGLGSALADEPRHVDEIAAERGLTPAAALATLLELEIAGQVRQLPGMRFVRTRPQRAVR